MSGGFFRGTSADQDTRFSNKQAKLMKSQKFPPELEHLVDMTKVKIEVLKPWIANRVTELIGFEDEVLINFIYTLLDGKVVNGKEIQISLTGFMERNTGKFMKELWSLLLSAQQNTSGVPQQFLDAKEEETRKKQAETDRITNEIERKREKEKLEMERGSFKKMDGDADNGRATNASLKQSKRQYRSSSRRSAEADKESDEGSGSRGRSSGPRSPRSADLFPSPRHKRLRSRSKSHSNSRSQLVERLESRKASRSPQSRGRSISSERRDHSPSRRSRSPRRRRSPRRYSSPPRRRYLDSRRRSISPSRYRSPSPRRQRMRSPIRRRYRSPIHRRSRSPVRHRSSSPSRSISRSPVRRRSPAFRRRSRTPVRQRSPIHFRRRSPPVPRRQYRRSPSPRHRSPSPLRRRSPTFRRRSVSPVRRRSRSPQDLSSPSAAHQSSPSPPVRRSSEVKGISPAWSPVAMISGRDKYSPAPNSSTSDDELLLKVRRGSDSSDHPLKSPGSLRSSHRDSVGRNGSRNQLSPLPPPPYRSPSGSESPSVEGRRGHQNEERFKGSYEKSMSIKKKNVIHPESLDPLPASKPQKVCHDNSDSSMDGESTKYRRDTHDKNYASHDNLKSSSDKVLREDKSPEKVAEDHTGKIRNQSTVVELRRKAVPLNSSERPGKLDRFGISGHKELTGSHRVTSSSKKGKDLDDEEGDRNDETNQLLLKNIKDQRQEIDLSPKLARKGDQHDKCGPADSRSDESDKERIKGKDKRKHQKSDREDIASDDNSSSDSYVEDRKEAKRRRKEEKKLKKDERRRRREERHRRKEERRAEKRRPKLTDATAPSSDSEGNLNGNNFDGERIKNQEKRSSGKERKEADPKALEIALREKALESLRAKKDVGRLK